MKNQPTLSLAGAMNALDPSNDEHWTKGGLPELAVLKALTGNHDLKRDEVTAICPDGYNRTNAHAAPSFEDGDENSVGMDAHAQLANDLTEAEAQIDTADPIALLEAAAAAAGQDHFRRNNALQAVIMAYRVSQVEIKDVQGRLDARDARRRERQQKVADTPVE